MWLLNNANDFRARLRFPLVTCKPPLLCLREEKRKGFAQWRVA
jgi:hypothetical protein